jgi:hypothetical protein
VTAPALSDTRRFLDLVARALRGDLSWAPQHGDEWDRIVRCAEQHGVAALFWRSIEGQPAFPSPLTAPLAALAGKEVARAAIRERELARVLGSFEAAGVDAIVIKGAALAYTRYDKPWLRARTDTDVLISRDSLDGAASALQSAGYTASANLSTGEFVSHQLAWERRDEHGFFHVVDVHWKVVNPQVLADAITFQDLWDSAHDVRAGAATLRVPHPVWSLLVACVHRLAHHQDQERLGWLFDIHLLARALEPRDWEQLLTIATARQLSAICEAGLTAAARHLATPLPAGMIEALNRAGAGDPSRAYTERDKGRLAVLRDDLRHLPQWKDRVRLLREHAFPPARFMMARYDSRRRAWLPAYYVHRLVTGAWKWMRA